MENYQERTVTIGEKSKMRFIKIEKKITFLFRDTSFY